MRHRTLYVTTALGSGAFLLWLVSEVSDRFTVLGQVFVGIALAAVFTLLYLTAERFRHDLADRIAEGVAHELARRESAEETERLARHTLGKRFGLVDLEDVRRRASAHLDTQEIDMTGVFTDEAEARPATLFGGAE